MALTKVTPTLVSDQVFGRRNLIINGDMRVAQRATSATVGPNGTGEGYQTLDRWNHGLNGDPVTTVSQSSTVPTGEGFANSMKIDVTTADTSVVSTEFWIMTTRLEGQDLQRIKKGTSNAEKLTLSFWVRSGKTGTYVVELEDSDNSRSVSLSYTISSADTWQKVELTFPADTTGAFDNDNAQSLSVIWWLVAGSNYTGSGSGLQTTWGSQTDNRRAVGQVNLFDSTSNEYYITGVQLEVGENATPFEHLTFDEQSSLCKRYYQQYSGFHAMPMWTYGRTNGSMQFVLEKEMRTQPTSSYSGTLGSLQTNSHCGIYESDWVTISSLSFSSTAAASNPKMMRLDSSHPTNTFASANVAVGFYAGDDFDLIFDAEL